MSGTERTPVVAVGIDGSPNADRALDWALSYARRSAAALRLIAAWETPMYFGRSAPREGDEAAEAAHRAMDHVCSSLPKEITKVERLVPVGRPGEVLVDLSRDADLLVVGRRGHQGASQLLLGSTSNYCVHHAAVPLVVVPECSDGVTTPEQKVVVGVDGSPDSITALHWAARYARLSGARLEIVTVWEWPVAYGYPVIPPEYSPEADAKLVADRAVAEIDLPADRVTVATVEGAPGPSLVRLSTDAELVVVGSRGHGAVGSVLLGSASNHCVHHAGVPVAVIAAR